MSARVRIYADEHVPKAVVNGIRIRGVDVLAPHDAEMLGASDEAQLTFATNAGRVFVTQDADLLRLHASGIYHAGIIYAPQGTHVGPFIRGIMLIVDVLSAEDMVRHVEFV